MATRPAWPAKSTPRSARHLLTPQCRDPALLVAEWARRTVEVLYRIYAHCLDGDDERWFARTEQALGRLQALICADAAKPVPHMFRKPRQGGGIR